MRTKALTNILLDGAFAVKELVKVDDRVERIVVIVSMCRSLFRVLVTCQGKVVRGESHRAVQIRRLLNLEMDAAAADGKDAVARILAKLVGLIFVSVPLSSTSCSKQLRITTRTQCTRYLCLEAERAS